MNLSMPVTSFISKLFPSIIRRSERTQLNLPTREKFSSDGASKSVEHPNTTTETSIKTIPEVELGAEHKIRISSNKQHNKRLLASSATPTSHTTSEVPLEEHVFWGGQIECKKRKIQPEASKTSSNNF